MEKEHIESIMGVEIFNWDGWDIVDTGWLQFFGVKFILAELVEYNNVTDAVSLKMNGDMEIYDEKGDSILRLNVGSLKSFRDALEETYG